MNLDWSMVLEQPPSYTAIAEVGWVEMKWCEDDVPLEYISITNNIDVGLKGRTVLFVEFKEADKLILNVLRGIIN